MFKLTNKQVKLTKQLHARKCYQHKILKTKNTGNIEFNQQKQPVTRNCYQQQTLRINGLGKSLAIIVDTCMAFPRAKQVIFMFHTISYLILKVTMLGNYYLHKHLFSFSVRLCDSKVKFF